MPNRVISSILKKFKKLINKNTKSRKQEKSITEMKVTSEKENNRVENPTTNSAQSKQSSKRFYLDSSVTIEQEKEMKSVEQVKIRMEITAPARLLKINEEEILDNCCQNEAQGNKFYKQGEKQHQEQDKELNEYRLALKVVARSLGTDGYVCGMAQKVFNNDDDRLKSVDSLGHSKKIQGHALLNKSNDFVENSTTHSLVNGQQNESSLLTSKFDRTMKKAVNIDRESEFVLELFREAPNRKQNNEIIKKERDATIPGHVRRIAQEVYHYEFVSKQLIGKKSYNLLSGMFPVESGHHKSDTPTQSKVQTLTQ